MLSEFLSNGKKVVHVADFVATNNPSVSLPI